jgi:hypothetical protein
MMGVGTKVILFQNQSRAKNPLVGLSLRDWSNGSTAIAGNHWVEIEVWGTDTNTDLGASFSMFIFGPAAYG